jgi:hypothetical protein
MNSTVMADRKFLEIIIIAARLAASVLPLF